MHYYNTPIPGITRQLPQQPVTLKIEFSLYKGIISLKSLHQRSLPPPSQHQKPISIKQEPVCYLSPIRRCHCPSGIRQYCFLHNIIVFLLLLPSNRHLLSLLSTYKNITLKRMPPISIMLLYYEFFIMNSLLILGNCFFLYNCIFRYTSCNNITDCYDCKRNYNYHYIGYAICWYNLFNMPHHKVRIIDDHMT